LGIHKTQFAGTASIDAGPYLGPFFAPLEDELMTTTAEHAPTTVRPLTREEVQVWDFLVYPDNFRYIAPLGTLSDWFIGQVTNIDDTGFKLWPLGLGVAVLQAQQIHFHYAQPVERRWACLAKDYDGKFIRHMNKALDEDLIQKSFKHIKSDIAELSRQRSRADKLRDDLVLHYRST
jgi:hypothetical protein